MRTEPNRVHVAKATTEMKRSGIEVRVAQCGRSRERVHVAKATTEMKRSGIEVRVAKKMAFLSIFFEGNYFIWSAVQNPA